MKFVSPAQRGTTCRCPWSGMPAPAMRPMFQPRLKPSGPYVAVERVETLRAEPMDLEGLGVVEVAEVHSVPVRRDEQMARRIRELVQEDERALAAMHDELALVVVGRGGGAEEAAVLLVRVLHVLEPPRRPQPLHRSSLEPALPAEEAEHRRRS